MSENNRPQQANDPYRNFCTLLFGYDFSHSADLTTHFFVSQIVLKWCFCEKVVADVWREVNRQNPKLRNKPIAIRLYNKMTLTQVFGELCKDIRKIPKIRERSNFKKVDFKKIDGILLKLKETFDFISEKRHALVHGKMLFEENKHPSLHIHDSSKNYTGPLSPIYSTRVVMKWRGKNKKEVVISMEQEKLREINERFDKFINLMRELFVQLDMGKVHILGDFEIKNASDPGIGFDRHGTKTTSFDKELSLREIQDVPRHPVGLPEYRHCRTCERDFIGDDVCKHLEMINEILTGKETMQTEKKD